VTVTALTVDGHVATITIAPPGGRYDRPFLDALAQGAELVRADQERIRAVVIAAAGPDFGAGWAEDALAEPDLPGHGAPPLGAAFDAVAAIPQPVVAAVEGAAHSAGLELALACDLRVAGAGATFQSPEAAWGLVPRGGATQRLPRAVGRAHALRLLLLGEAIDSREAYRIGLVTEETAAGGARDRAWELAARIAQRGPVATRFAKEAVHRGVEMPLEQALRYELDLTVILQTTRDRAEGVRAFVERRAPRFTGE